MQGIGSPGIIKQASGIKIIPSNPIKPKPPGVNWPLYPKPGKPVHWPIKPVYHPIYKPVPVVVSRPVYVAARPVLTTPGPCTCLSKEYTPQGAVVFKDRCTTEMAMNPPVGCAVIREVDEESPGPAPGFLLLRTFRKT